MCYRKEGEPPLIKGWIPFLGKALEFRKNSHEFLTNLQQEHGDVFTVLIAGIFVLHTQRSHCPHLDTLLDCNKKPIVTPVGIKSFL